MNVRSLALALSVILLAASLAASGSSGESGYWEELGEDGAIFVPHTPPLEPAYLPEPSLGDYHNASEAVAAITALATARPDLVSVRVAGTSVQGRPILVATLTAPGDPTGRTRVLFDGAHHGDEVIAAEVLTRFLQRAVAEYDTNASMQAALAQAIVDVVPMVNPDGIEHVPACTHYAQCRKNARGVDLNRNYPAHWGGTGSSGDPSSATYRGPSPASEPETRAIRDLLDQNDHAIYASLHSGAEMILWPWGWTTAAPPEASVYEQLGGELTAITGAPHGQVSKILYGVSGDSMDQAYGAAAGWRAIAISPETYKGSGSAFDWWYLFNPPENDANIAPVVARWDRFLWHLVVKAPEYAPARLEAPSTVSLGPDAGDINVLVTGAPRRPLKGASLSMAAEGDALTWLSANPVALADQSAPQARTFQALPNRGGTFDGTILLDAGPAGIVRRSLELQLVQVGLALALDKSVVESPDSNTATVVLDAGPFASVVGDVTLTAEPQGLALASASFAATPGSPATLVLPFDAHALRGGAHTIVARATFQAEDDGGIVRPGQLRDEATLMVLRPQVDIDKRFMPTTIAGQGLPVVAVYRNTGTSTAHGLVVRETVPVGYSYYVRDGPVPVPLDPLGRPAPAAVEPQPDGSVVLVWELGDVAPGQLRAVQYRLLALVPGSYALPSAWSYSGVFATATLEYAEDAAPAHTVRMP